MAIPQESVNVQLDKNGKLPDEGLDAIKRDIAALSREARGPHNNRSERDAANCHPQSAITGLEDDLLAISGDLDTTLTYDGSGNLTSMTTALGSKTFTYDGSGNLTEITGTGLYATKSFTYDGSGNLTNIDVA